MSGQTLIQWREWGKEAFEEARQRDIPILLDIGAVWCHWCHVMDTGIPGDPTHTGAYSDPRIAGYINERYVPVKVDTDRRPDVNARYNMGGWPTTAFLTPDGDTLYGETYVTPGRMMGLLQYVAEYYRTHKDEIAGEVAQHKEALQRSAAEPPAEGRLSAEIVNAVADSVKSAFDFAYGGFGSQPKFPHPEALAFAIEEAVLTSDSELRLVAEKTLDAMCSGGMYDRYAGGFFRYSTTRDWSIPHYEKMLQDNARLASVCLMAARAFGEVRFADVARDVHRWAFDILYDPELGVFAGSQDADREEAYYGLPLDERAKLPTPYIDRTVYADWNALMVSSLIARHRQSGEADILAIATKTFAFLEERMAAPSEAGPLALRHFYAGGEAQGTTGLLTDQAAFIAAALDLYEATGDRRYGESAVRAAEFVLAGLEDKEGGGFYDSAPDPSALGMLAQPKREIGENSDTALALLRLADCELMDSGDLRHAVARALASFAEDFRAYAFLAGGYGRAVQASLSPGPHIVLGGDPADPRLVALRQAAWQVFSPHAMVETRTADRAGDYAPAPDGSPRAYVCVGARCLAPVSDPAELSGTLAGLLHERESAAGP